MPKPDSSSGLFRYVCKNYPKCEKIFLSNKKDEAMKSKTKHEKTCTSR